MDRSGEERRVSLFETQLQEQADRIEKLKVESFESDIRLWGDREAELRTRRVHRYWQHISAESDLTGC